ncbi:DUF1156 domain-containing protein [Thermodesulfovibrio sp. TK110]
MEKQGGKTIREKMKKAFIEESFPIKEVSEESAREKNIRHGHISTLHIWWARRPLASSRTTSYAALIPAPKNTEERNKTRDFIINLAKWENSLNSNFIKKAREDILKESGGKPPRVLDPFSGGGSIPLEALRLGCEVHALEYNPVATLILKCTLEYPQKYGKKIKKKVEEGSLGISSEIEVNPLLEDVKKWGNWVLESAKKEIGRFYPEDNDGSIPVGYIWARTVPCQNPTCNAEIPLMRQFWLAKKENKKVSLYPYVEGKEVKFKIVGDGYEKMPSGFDPEKGTVSRAIARCLVCGSTVDDNTVRKLFQQGKTEQRMVAVVLHHPNRGTPKTLRVFGDPQRQGKTYRLATENDMEVFKEAEKYLEEKRQKLMEEWGIDPVPDEPLVRVPVTFGVINVWVYGMNTWGDLFNSRQKLALITFTEKVRQSYKKMIEEGYDEEYAKAMVSYLAISIDNIAEKNNSISRWANTKETIAGSFSRQALPMIWDYFESNPFCGSTGDWLNSLEYNLSVVKHCSLPSYIPATVTQGSATSLPYPDNHFDAVFTDPPYYDNVPYSYLSDFFYVWLKRAIGDLYPDLFTTPLTPKKNEIVAYSHGEGGFEAGKRCFEENLKKSFKEINRVLKPEAKAVIVYAHKSTEGWETLINSLLDSGLVITASWPINTEMQARLRANKSAVLASSIYIVALKIERISTGWFNDVKEEIKKHLTEKLERLWAEGISGADFFIAGIGSAIELFGKYEKVMDYEGNIIRANKLLEFVREMVTDYAVRQILHNGVAGEISALTRFYILYRWTFKESKVVFDEARKLAQSVGVDLEKFWNKGFIKKEKEFIKVLGPHERALEDLNLKVQTQAAELIDVLHQSLIFWERGKRDEIIKLLNASGYGEKDILFRVAQAVSECLPNDSKEKKLLDGFLTGKERLIDELKTKKPQQQRLI